MKYPLPLFIPSRSRHGIKSLTMERLGPAVLVGRPVALVVPYEQHDQYLLFVERYRKDWGTRVHVMSERGVKGIAATRKLIGTIAAERAYDSFVMLDDDLRFMHRGSATDWHLFQNSSEDCRRMLRDMEQALLKYAHVGISPRQANNHMDTPYELNVRPLRVLGYQTELFNQCHHGRVAVMEDFDVTLQLLARGYDNCMLTMWVQDQYATQLAGGCSDYRTHQLHERNVKKMHSLWPEVSKLRTKKNKTGGEFGECIELTIQWKKALGLYARQLI